MHAGRNYSTFSPSSSPFQSAHFLLIMSALVVRFSAFAVGATAGCASGMACLYSDIYRAHDAVGRSVSALEEALRAPAGANAQSKPVTSSAIVAASPHRLS